MLVSLTTYEWICLKHGETDQGSLSRQRFYSWAEEVKLSMYNPELAISAHVDTSDSFPSIFSSKFFLLYTCSHSLP